MPAQNSARAKQPTPTQHKLASEIYLLQSLERKEVIPIHYMIYDGCYGNREGKK